MKRFLFNCALAVGVFSISIASANTCCPVQYNDCCFDSSFDGWYIGGNVGVFTHEAHRNDRDGFMNANSGWTVKNTDVTAGLQLGYDWLCGSTVFGLVGDWNWTNTRARLNSDPNDPDEDNFFNSRANWFSTIRLRAGLTVCDALIYVTGGAAATRFNNRWFDDDDGDFRFHRTQWGWVGGVGTEFILGCNWSLGFEFLCMHFDERVRTFTNDDGDTFDFGHSDNTYVGRVLLNYRFGDLCGCW